MRYYLAVDIGASSGRHILCHLEGGRLILEEIYRFPNRYSERNGHSCWDIDLLFSHILKGLAVCKQLDKIPVSLGIDTWAVDFVLLDEALQRIGNAVAYRDRRTQGMDQLLEQSLSFEALYKRTGIQKQSFNTIYQLAALKRAYPHQLAAAKHFLMIPDYFNFLLTGKIANEYTNATSTALVSLQTKQWDKDLLHRIGLPEDMFGDIYMAGESLGGLRPEIQQQIGFNCELCLPATHDTGSAFLAVPAIDDRAAYLSSGTWSLLGVELAEPIANTASMQANFTNEGGFQYRYRFLKNIMGLWIIQSIRHDSGDRYSFSELEEMAKASSDFASIVDVESNRFLSPDNMLEEIKAACRDTGQAVPESIGEVMQCVYQSLAVCYRAAVAELQRLTGKQFRSLNIVGGGSKDGYLNQLTANAVQIPVYAGPTEGTALGNLLVQMIANKEFSGLTAAREAIRNSFKIEKYTPTGGSK